MVRRFPHRGVPAPAAADAGYHNRNYPMRATSRQAERWGVAPGAPVKLRVPIEDAPRVVVRAWPDEAEVLDAVGRSVPGVPRRLAGYAGCAVYTYAPGRVLSALCPPGRPLGEAQLAQIADVFAATAAVDTAGLPPLPAGWPGDGDSTGFLRHLARLVEEQVHRPNRAEFGGLLEELGVPADAMDRFAGRLGRLTPRPFALLHTDLHRDNLVVQPDGGFFVLDWELAMVGDPLYELATHLCRMRYPAEQWGEVVVRWRRAVRRVRPGAADGLAEDLPRYLDFERAQSVYPDIVRAARGLGPAPGRYAVARAARQVRLALERARSPLLLADCPDLPWIRRCLARFARRPAQPSSSAIQRSGSASGVKPTLA